MWSKGTIAGLCEIEYGTRVVRKNELGDEYPVYGGGGETFRINRKNRTDRLIISRFGMSERCARFVAGDFFLNDSGLTVSPKISDLSQAYLDKVILEKNGEIFSLGRGSAQKNLNMNGFKELCFEYPPLAEQQRIVAKLDAAFAEIDGAIEAADVQVGNIDMLRQRILNGWIENNANSQDYYTVQDCIDNKWIKPPFDGNHGETHPKASDYKAAGIPFIMARDLSNGDVNIIDCKFIAPEQASSLRVGFAENDDVLFTHKGTIGEVALLKCEVDFVMLTPQVTAYRVIDETRVDRIYLYFLFKSAFFQSQIQQIAGIGTTRAYIGITRQKQLNLCLPPIHLQQEAVRILTSSEPHVSTISSANIQKLEQLSKLKSAILAQELQSEAA
jgi:type I restriction enzyme, S subunit